MEEAIQIVEKNTLILEASLVYKEYAYLLFKQGNYKEGFLVLEKYDQFNYQIFEKERLRASLKTQYWLLTYSFPQLPRLPERDGQVVINISKALGLNSVFVASFQKKSQCNHFKLEILGLPLNV